jgi:hypothetical protein
MNWPASSTAAIATTATPKGLRLKSWRKEFLAGKATKADPSSFIETQIGNLLNLESDGFLGELARKSYPHRHSFAPEGAMREEGRWAKGAELQGHD